MVREVHLPAFALALADDALVVDIRQPDEYHCGHVPGARLMPLESLPDWGRKLPTDRPVYVISARGQRSRRVVAWLRAGGVDAYSVAGGTGGWARTGRPLVSGLPENAA
jgi:rhodanese-related sulfurtransferase